MAFRGNFNGIPTYDILEDVPDALLKSGRDIYIINVPGELSSNGKIFLQAKSPLGLVGWVLITIFATFVVVTLVQLAFLPILNATVNLVRGREGKKLDDRHFESSGCLFELQDDGTWKVLECAGDLTTAITIGAVAIAAAVGIFALVIFGSKRKTETTTAKK